MTPGIRANGPSYLKPLALPAHTRADSRPRLHDLPIVITRTIANRQLVVNASDSATQMGVHSGLTLTESNAICPGLVHFEQEPERDQRAIEALARWMFRFTPRVCLPTRAKNDDENPEGDCIYLDITGCERLYHGFENLAHEVQTALSRLRLSATIAVAPTPGAAWAFATFSDAAPIIAPDQLPRLFPALPIAALRLIDDILDSLHHLGLESVGQLMRLPRSALPARFGSMLLERIDQALGRISEPLIALEYQAPVQAEIEFDGVVDSLEAIWMVFKDLLAQLIEDLTKRGAGARRIDVEFRRPYMSSIERTIQLSRPSRDPKNLFNLLRCSMEGLEEEAQRQVGIKSRKGKINRALFLSESSTGFQPVHSVPQRHSTRVENPCYEKTITRHEEYICNGFIGIRITVPLFDRIHDEQINLGGETEQSAGAELANLIERLRIRLNLESVEKVALAESYLPERAYSCKEAVEEEVQPSSFNLHPYVPSRPLHLLADPIEINVMVSPSEDRDGRPILFRLDNELHELTQAIGPERIAGEWWHGHHRTRDYFDAEDRNGKRFWLFRVQETSRWYLHGEFE
jgi:protein ImuB